MHGCSALQAALATLYWLALTRLPPELAAPVLAWATGPTFAGYGCVFALMPALITDAFGQKHAAANFGCLYLAKAAGAVLSGPAAALARESTGDWSAVLLGLALASAAAAAIVWLKIAPELPRVRARVQALDQPSVE